ncbi:hypothetical protein PFISCL1PPCAC_2507, partial [Pristionchus fissidentatus]
VALLLHVLLQLGHEYRVTRIEWTANTRSILGLKDGVLSAVSLVRLGEHLAASILLDDYVLASSLPLLLRPFRLPLLLSSLTPLTLLLLLLFSSFILQFSLDCHCCYLSSLFILSHL